MGKNGNDDDGSGGGSIPSMFGRPATYQGYHVSFGTIRLPEERHMFEDTRHPYIKYTVQGERRRLF